MKMSLPRRVMNAVGVGLWLGTIAACILRQAELALICCIVMFTYMFIYAIVYSHLITKDLHEEWERLVEQLKKEKQW